MKPIVVKIGGSTLGSHDTTLEDLVSLQKQGKLLVVVHGGGRLITDWLEKQGVPTRFVQGQRVTDEQTLQVVVAVLAGLVNKEIVATINSLGGKALGLSGIDGHFLEARIKSPEMGLTGEVTKVNLELLKMLLQAGYIPVVAPSATDQQGKILNINADIASGEIAAAIQARKLIFLSDVAGINDNFGETISRLSPEEARNLITSGVASGGMIPKIEACLCALSTVPITRIIDGRVAHALLKEMKGRGKGTTISQRTK